MTGIPNPFAKLLSKLFFPANCSICSGIIETLELGTSCQNCWNDTVILNGSEDLCNKCGRTLQTAGRSCKECSGYHFDSALALGPYEGALKASVLSLKSDPHIPSILKDRIRHRIAHTSLSSDLIVPVPLSKRRRFERGYNQAEIIAEVVSRATRINTDAYSLARIKHVAAHRAGMDKLARERSVADAFSVLRPRLVEGKRILLVDDVLTSGSTASACAKELKANGALSVSLFTIARV